MKKPKRFRTEYFFVTPSFLLGAGSILSIAGNYFQLIYSKSDYNEDERSLEADWNMVGQDIRDAAIDFKFNN